MRRTLSRSPLLLAVLALGACASLPTGPLDASRPPPQTPPPLLAIAPGAEGHLALIAERADSTPPPDTLPFRLPTAPHFSVGHRSGLRASALLRFDLSPVPSEAELREVTLVLTSLGERYGAPEVFIHITLLPMNGATCDVEATPPEPERTLRLPMHRQLHVDRLDVTPLLRLARDLHQAQLCFAVTYPDAAEFWKSWGGASAAGAPNAPRLELVWEG